MPKVSKRDGESQEDTYLETVEKASWNWFYTQYIYINIYFKLLQSTPKQHLSDNAVENRSKMAKRLLSDLQSTWYEKGSDRGGSSLWHTCFVSKVQTFNAAKITSYQSKFEIYWAKLTSHLGSLLRPQADDTVKVPLYAAQPQSDATVQSKRRNWGIHVRYCFMFSQSWHQSSFSCRMSSPPGAAARYLMKTVIWPWSTGSWRLERRREIQSRKVYHFQSNWSDL